MSDSYIWLLPAFAKEVENYLIWTCSLRQNSGVYRKDLMLPSGGILFPFTPSKQSNRFAGCELHKAVPCGVFSQERNTFLMGQCIISLTIHEFPALFPWLVFTSSHGGFPCSSREESAIFFLWWEIGGTQLGSDSSVNSGVISSFQVSRRRWKSWMFIKSQKPVSSSDAALSDVTPASWHSGGCV